MRQDIGEEQSGKTFHFCSQRSKTKRTMLFLTRGYSRGTEKKDGQKNRKSEKMIKRIAIHKLILNPN